MPLLLRAAPARERSLRQRACADIQIRFRQPKPVSRKAHPLAPTRESRDAWQVPALSPELRYVALLFALFVIPRVLQRWRIPAALTSIGLGAIAGMGLHLFLGDPTIELLGTLGIVSLFLFAGLEVDFGTLRTHGDALAQHALIGAAALLGVTVLSAWAFEFDARIAVLLALALLTPSTGFILDSLRSLGVTDTERVWIKAKAIASELVALGALFVALASVSPLRLLVSIVALIALVTALPLAFRIFAEHVVPFAPRSEFAFLLMIAVISGVATRELGVYYLVGAFVVGLTAQRFRHQLPAVASERMLDAVEVFASVFVPFYFFEAGLRLRVADFSLRAAATALLFLALALPIRIFLVAAHDRVARGEALAKAARIGIALLPTLVFTLVIADILRDRFAAPRWLFGGLILYTLVNTAIPSATLRTVAPKPDPSVAAP